MKSLLTITAAIMLLMSCTKTATDPTISNVSYTVKVKYSFTYQSKKLTFVATPDTTIKGLKLEANFSYDWYNIDTLKYRYHWNNQLLPASSINTLQNNPEGYNIRNITLDSVWIVSNNSGYKINLVY